MTGLRTAALAAALSIATGLAPAPPAGAPPQPPGADGAACGWRAAARTVYDELADSSDAAALILRGILARAGVAEPGFLSGACPGGGRPGTSTTGVPHPDHIVVVVEENQDAAAVLGTGAAPYLDSLAARGASFTAFTAETHPSQPNYLALFSGDTQGVSDDSCLTPLSAPNLGAELRAAGRSFVGYSDDLPQAGFTGCAAGGYVQKHAPWTVFADLPATANQPFTAWPVDLAQLPAVAFVAPNLCHDMHDCDIATGDAWLRTNLAGYADWAPAHNSWLVITWDEASDSAPDNRIPTVIVGAGIRPGTYPEPADHYRLLRTITDAEGLAPLGRAADTSPITDIWASGAPAVSPAGGSLPLPPPAAHPPSGSS